MDNTEDLQHKSLMAELERHHHAQEQKLEYERYDRDRGRVNRKKLGLLIALSALPFTSIIIFDFGESSLVLLKIIGAALLVLTLVAGAFTYLQPSTASPPSRSAEEAYARARFYLDERLDEFKRSLNPATPSAASLTEADRATILSNIQAKLESDTLQSYVAGITDLVTKRIYAQSNTELFRATADRLGREVQDQAKRGNLNLILGIMTTLLGLAILGYSVFYLPATTALQEVLYYFVPRVSLVVLVEIFAYFFLRLYKQSLAEIKYFQNEITNIETRHLATQIAAAQDDQSARLRVVDQLLTTERNFILSKDQTTVDLERERISRTTYADAFVAVKELLKRKD